MAILNNTNSTKLPTRKVLDGIKKNPSLIVIPDTSSPASRSAGKRLLRKHQVLNCIREQEGLSRAEISKTIGFNLPTVSSLVDELVLDQLAVESEARESPMGRRPIPVSLNEKAASILGIDVGKRQTVALITNLNGQIIYQLERPSKDFQTADDYLTFIYDLIDSMEAKFRLADTPPLAGAGIAIPGLVPLDIEGGSQTVSNILASKLSEALGVTVFVENDARAMAFAELWFGSGKKCKSFLNLNIGEGLGMGIVEDGNIVRGSLGYAGEIGQIPLGDVVESWPTGVQRCLENVASGAGLRRMAKEAGLGDLEGAEIAELARKGNKKAQKIFHKFADTLAMGIATVINLYNPQRIILSGRVIHSIDVFQYSLNAAIPNYTLKSALDQTEVMISEMIETAGSLGAAALVLHHIFTCSHVSLQEVL